MRSVAWMSRARCRGRTDLNFFPEKGEHAPEVVEFCSGCPVRVQCLDYALARNLDDGIWGGVTANRRVRARRAAARAQ